MKKIILVSLVLLSMLSYAVFPSDSLVNALCKIESNNDVTAVGDGGKAVGVLQIWKAVVDDVNSWSSEKFTYDDRKSLEKSKKICKLYINHYATKKRLGRTPTSRDMARIWNGGPNGYKKSSTLGYWKKVKAEFNQFFMTASHFSRG